ncbi:hypothetical protein E1B28_008968 [Marasmius oreades]|uniref:Metaxin glutathione S-transferase domain-containing protein n=1 Tax=Marasmius oreades TaxID=181124 RepID=A0A9P7RZM1_9AGAR|nr:uncharacterized protein E1B28_008968 [Marasmius oreades]KAG7092625.1 hypothetical protein E1B28_008968 [Marasmius oreades]
MQIPQPLSSLFAHFPLYTWPPIYPSSVKAQLTSPTIWINPSSDPDSPLLSGDVECLKWQAYLALRGLNNVQVRTDIHPEGAIDGRLPNIHVALPEKSEIRILGVVAVDSSTHLLSAHHIPGWVDAQLNHNPLDVPLEGYKDEAARDESRAWVSLLEGSIHAALIMSTQPTLLSSLTSFLSSPTLSLASSPAAPAITSQLRSLLVPPPPPQTGLTSIPFSLFPPWGVRVHKESVMAKYSEAVSALSERLGTDKWFLGSDSPTPLDALAFAYLHCILLTSDPSIRTELTKRVNLVAWEWKVRGMVRAAFVREL